MCAEPDIPGGSSPIPSATDSIKQLRAILVDNAVEHWDAIAPLLKERGIEHGVDTREHKKKAERLAKENARLKNELKDVQGQLAQERARSGPSTPGTPQEDNSRPVQSYRFFLLPSLNPERPHLRLDRLETLMAEASSMTAKYSGENFFGRGRIGEIQGLASSTHLDKSAMQLALVMATDWCSAENPTVKLADLNVLSQKVDENTPASVYGLLIVLLSEMVEEVAGEFVVADDELRLPEAIILLRLLHFLLHHIPSPLSSMWRDFATLRSRVERHLGHPLVKGLFNILLAWLNRDQPTSLANELRKITPAFSADGRHFVLDGSDLFVVDAVNKVMFVPSAEYKVTIVPAERRNWVILVESPVLGSHTFFLLDPHAPRATQTINQFFRKQLEAQYAREKVDPAQRRNICW